MTSLDSQTLPRHLKRGALRGLYAITDERMGGGHVATAQAALEGGARILQLRDKTTPPRQLLPIALQLRVLTRQFGALFIINDSLDLALAARADGVHLGPEDWPVAVARGVLGPHFLIGASCHDLAEARRAEIEGADYIGVGAIFATQTKLDAGDAIGLEALREIARGTMLPIAAIGGIEESNIGDLPAAGAEMACVVSAIARAGNPIAMSEAARCLHLVFQRASESQRQRRMERADEVE